MGVVEIVPDARERLPLVERFAAATWTRPRSAAHARWRSDAPDARGFLAVRDGECLAMVRAFRRLYRLDDSWVPFLEPFDWATRPDLHGSGLGVRVLERLMREPEPLLVVGGSDEACALLARRGWRRAGAATRFARALAPAVARSAARRLRLPPGAAAIAARGRDAWLAARGARAPRGGRVVAVAAIGAEVDALYRGRTAYGTLALWTRERLRWLAADFAGAGHFVPLYFAQDDRLRGWALLRVVATEDGTSAELVDLLDPAADRAVYGWMIGEAVRIARAFGAERIGAATTCAAVAAALGAHGFAEAGALPIHVWPPARGDLPGPLLLGSNTRDTALHPFPKRWWGDPLSA